MRLTPYLNFNGQCEEAMKFYEKVFGGKILMMMSYGDSPAAGESPPEMHKMIMHARLAIGDALLMASDTPPDDCNQPGMSVAVGVESAEEAERIFAGLSEGATVTLPIQETFWSVRFGMLTDRFGTPWMINCEKAPG